VCRVSSLLFAAWRDSPEKKGVSDFRENACQITINKEFYIISGMQIIRNAVLLITFSAILLGSCRREGNIGQVQNIPCFHNTHTPVSGFALNQLIAAPGYDSAFCGLLPTHRNSYWIYTDSLFSTTGALTDVFKDTLRITAIYRSPVDRSIWWDLRANRMKGLTNHKLLTTDSALLLLDIAFANPPYYVLNRWLHHPATDTVNNFGSVGDLAYWGRDIRVPVVSVPAGNFTGCISNNKFWGVYSEEIVVKPGTGVLKYTWYYNSVFPPNQYKHGPKRQVSVLTAFHLF
jgi:hypothetical protein